MLNASIIRKHQPTTIQACQCSLPTMLTVRLAIAMDWVYRSGVAKCLLMDDVSAKHHQQLLEYRTYTRNTWRHNQNRRDQSSLYSYSNLLKHLVCWAL